MTLFNWFQQSYLIKLLIVGLLATLLNACGSSGTAVVAATPASTMTVKLKVDPLTRLVTGEAVVSGFTATALHIHEGATGVSGPILITLNQDSSDANKFTTPEGARFSVAQFASYLAGNTYFNSHSTANPTGEVRAQNVANIIDTSTVTIDSTTGAVSGYLMVSGFTPTLAHIHTGFAGQTGGITVTFEADPTITGRFNPPTAASVSVTDYSAGKLYFNVHSAEFTTGQIREQIVPANVQVLGFEISGDQVAPITISGGGTATAYLTVDETTGAVNAVLDLHNITNSTNAHIHDGVAGVSGGILQGFTGAAGDTTWTITGATLAAGAGNALEKLLAGDTYINVHTSANPTGEARGQIVPRNVVMARSVLTAADAQTAGTNTSGTSSGSAVGYVTVNKNLTPASIKANLAYSGVTPTLAHVHTEVGGVIVLDLAPSSGSGTATGTLDTTKLSEFTANQFYFNLHTAANPGGELRGQIVP